MHHEPSILVGRLRICALRRDVVDRFAVLALIASDHVYGLLNKIEMKVLRAVVRRKVEIAVYVSLAASIEKSIDVRLIPAGLFDRLKFTIEIV